LALPVKIALVPVLLISALWAFAPVPIGLISATCSFVLVLLPWWSYCVWREGDQQQFPLFAAIGTMYVLSYVVPLYIGEHLMYTSFGPRVISPEAMHSTMLLVLIGVSALGLGMAVRIPDGYARQWNLDFQEKPLAWNFVRLVFVVTALFTAFFGIGAFGAGARQAIVDLDLTVNMAAFLALFRRYLRGQSEWLDRVLLVGFVILRLYRGIASGWLGDAVWLVVVLGIGYFDVRRRIPKAIVVGMVIAILFLQPGKTEFRQRYWRGIGATVGTVSERATFWLSASGRAWSDALERPEKRSKLFGETVSRVSLLEPTAMVMQMTPSQVPYQNGRLYGYLAISLIPRAVWPDKPSFSEANQFYQVAYGITDRRHLSKVSMSVGSLAESYINFGWFGPPFVMLVIGLLLNILRRYFLDAGQGEFLHCLGIALLPILLTVGSQAAQYLAGIVQAVLLTIVILMPALCIPRPTAERNPVTRGAG
jgi:energy-converting hydrogenase Eha subunit B